MSRILGGLTNWRETMHCLWVSLLGLQLYKSGFLLTIDKDNLKRHFRAYCLNCLLVMISVNYIHQEDVSWDSPGGPVAKTLYSMQGPGFDPWSGNQIPRTATKSWRSQINKLIFKEMRVLTLPPDWGLESGQLWLGIPANSLNPLQSHGIRRRLARTLKAKPAHSQLTAQKGQNTTEVTGGWEGWCIRAICFKCTELGVKENEQCPHGDSHLWTDFTKIILRSWAFKLMILTMTAQHSILTRSQDT